MEDLIKIKTVTSVSGGKTSAMMAVEHPTDYYIFSCVLTDQVEVAPKDKGLLREIQKKLPQFKASRELDLTLKNVLNLEELIGKQIDWVSSELTFDELITKRKMLPNQRRRFCTEELKLNPIFWHCYLNYLNEEPLLMNIGFRYDENKRVERVQDCKYSKYKFPKSCNLNGSKRQKWETIEWRMLRFPLWETKTTNNDVIDYWNKKGWKFPQVSNCDFCFHHRGNQQKLQNSEFPQRANWWINKELEFGKTFAKTDLQSILLNQNLNTIEKYTDCNCTD